MDNRTDFAVHPQLLLDVDGERLVAMVKASFELSPGSSELEIAPEERNRGIRLADIPWGEPEISSIAYPADVCIRKPGTDVIVVGKAYAPRDVPVATFDARVEVGSLSRSVRISGPRVWTAGGGGLTKPAPLAELELRYEYAWGGFDDSDPAKIVEEPRNPIGRGKVRDPESLTHEPAPQIEDPATLITSFRTEPAPAGVGAIGRHWEPRRRYAGTYDAVWLETRAPLPPDDLDDRHHLCASPGLTSTPPLEGGELVRLLNLLPGGGARQLALPKIEVQIEFRLPDASPVVLRPYLDTVLIDLLETSADKPPAVELVWRASIRAPRRQEDCTIVVRERDFP